MRIMVKLRGRINRVKKDCQADRRGSWIIHHGERLYPVLQTGIPSTEGTPGTTKSIRAHIFFEAPSASRTKSE